MGYAVRKDDGGKRFVDSVEDLTDEEEFFEDDPDLAVVSTAGYAANVSGPPGWRRVSGPNELEFGEIFSAEMPSTSLQALIDQALADIDRHYETLYRGSVVNSAIGAEYDAAYIVAKEWMKDTNQPAPERVKALAESYGVTNVVAAQVVISKWTEAQAVAFDLRGAARLRAKLAIRQAQDAAGVAAAEAAGRAAMEAVVFSI